MLAVDTVNIPTYGVAVNFGTTDLICFINPVNMVQSWPNLHEL